MSASITEAHRKLAYELMQMDDRLSAFAHRTAAQLIANSEARAVAAAVTALTCTHHNDQQRVACPVCLVTALTAERDKLRAQNDQFSDNLSAVGAVYNAEKARAERAEAELATCRESLHLADGTANLALVHRDAAEAELATEQARSTIHASFCDDALTLCEDTGIAGHIIAKMRELRRAAIDAAMKEGA